jgi:hypothetical protein
MAEGSSHSRLSSVIQTVAALLFLIIVASISLAPPTLTLDDLEKIVTADRSECYMGESIKVSFIIQNSLDHDVRLEPVRHIAFMTSQGGESWVSAEVHMDYRTGALINMPSGGNYTLHSQVFTPTLPGFFKVNALGESLRVWVHPYKEETLDSPRVYLNISAVNRVRVGEELKATFDIVNDNDYVIQLKYSSVGTSYGYVNESNTSVIEYVEGFCRRVQPHSRYTYRTIYFSPSRPGEYLLVFNVDKYETLRRVKVESREGTVLDIRYIT